MSDRRREVEAAYSASYPPAVMASPRGFTRRGSQPSAPPEPFTPIGNTIAAVQAYIDGLGDPADTDVQTEIGRVLDIEEENAARSTLITWLEARVGNG